jgi:long-chain acyl-CoA synthetase
MLPTWIIKSFFLFIFRLFWRLRIEGKAYLPRQGPYLVCPNHASFLDGLFVFTSLPFKISLQLYFLGYQRIFEHPLLSWVNKTARLLSVDTNADLTLAMQTVSFVLSRQKNVCIFPEGMRSIDTSVKEFKKGVGILVKELDMPVVPVFIKGSHQSWPRGSHLPRFYPIKVIFGRPFHAEELKKQGLNLGAKDDYEAIALGLRQAVLKLNRLT